MSTWTRTFTSLLVAVGLTLSLGSPAIAGIVIGGGGPFDPGGDAFIQGVDIFFPDSFFLDGPVLLNTSVAGPSRTSLTSDVSRSQFGQRLATRSFSRTDDTLMGESSSSGDYARALQDEAWRDDGAVESSTTQRDYRTVNEWLAH